MPYNWGRPGDNPVPQPVMPGNMDLTHRPVVQNPDGSLSTVRSISITDDKGRATLIPTVLSGQIVPNDLAIRHYQDTGENYGTFRNEKEANLYADWLHLQQAALTQNGKPATDWRSVGKS